MHSAEVDILESHICQWKRQMLLQVTTNSEDDEETQAFSDTLVMSAERYVNT